MDLPSRSGPFNWVKARADCNLDLSFQALRSVVERDVREARNTAALTQCGTQFEFQAEAQGILPMFTVRRIVGNRTQGQAIFTQEAHAITVDFGSGSSESSFEVTAEWDEKECACRLSVDNDPCEIWQISRRALEWLFFGPLNC